MPTYQYRCKNCGHDLEIVQKFTDPALTQCPDCDGELRRVYNAVGVVFKGSGFYKTDSRSSQQTTTPSGEAKSQNSKAGSSDSASGSSASASTTTPAPSTAASTSSSGSTSSA